MSLYNALFGVNAAAPVLLAMLGIDTSSVPRFRDCYLKDGKIAIHTRTGGGNRDMYEHEERARANYPEYFTGKDDPSGPWNADLRKLPGFIYDEDDDFDSTYATFYFAVPERFAHLIEKIPEGVDHARKWMDAIEELKNAQPDDPQVKKLEELFKPLFDAIKDGKSGVFTV